jgi:hypothetical protein
MAFATAAVVSLALLPASLTGCARSTPLKPYPLQDTLTVFAELKLYLDQDPYRMAPGRDLEGHNVFRISLERLETMESMTPDVYDDVLAFARGECLERTGDWTAAAAAFDRAASATTTLANPARLRAEAARRMARLTDREGFDRRSLEGYLNDLEVMERRLGEWAGDPGPAPYAGFALAEAARGREERAALLLDHRRVLADGAMRAARTAEGLVETHAESWRVSEFRLLQGSIYEQLGRDIARQWPPEGREFDAMGTWAHWIEQARLAYRKVALTDGDPVKPEGEARLRALDAYALRVRDLAR